MLRKHSEKAKVDKTAMHKYERTRSRSIEQFFRMSFRLGEAESQLEKMRKTRKEENKLLKEALTEELNK